MATDNLLTMVSSGTTTSSSGANTAAAGTDNSIIDAALYASNSITSIGGSAYSPTPYASKTAQISLNDPLVRAMANVPSGQISFSSFGSKTIYTGTWRSRISFLAQYSVPTVNEIYYGWGANASVVNAMSNVINPSLYTYMTRFPDPGNTFVTGNTVGLYEPNDPQGPAQIAIAGVIQSYISLSSGTNINYAYYVFSYGNTASTNLHSLRIGTNVYSVGNQSYPSGGYQNFGNVSAGNVGGYYSSANNLTFYAWGGYGTNTAMRNDLANIYSAYPLTFGNVTTFYVT